MTERIEFFQDSANGHRFRVRGDNGEIVATSEGYTRHGDARRGAGTLTRLLLPKPPVIRANVLDHGFVQLRNLAGPTRRNHMPFDAHDTDPAQAARMSFDNFDEDRTEEQDYSLSRYLMSNWHTSPFEMIECWIEMKLPIFVARQFVRHRTVSLNEVSARYVTLPEEWYIPEIVGAVPPKGGAKQGQVNTLPGNTQIWFQNRLRQRCDESYKDYLIALENGVAPEHARMFLHVNHYTHWLWKQDLHNILNFLRLRDHFHAQIEAQKYAQAVDGMLRSYLPKSMELYDEYRRLKVRTQAGWLLDHPEHDSELVPFNPHLPPLTDADRQAGWVAEPLFMES